MTDQYMVSMMDTSRNMSFDSSGLLTCSTINGLHFPGLTTSELSDTGGGGSRRTSFLYDSPSMCESMIESFSSAGRGGDGGQDDTILINHANMLQSDPSIMASLKIEKRDSFIQRKRRSRKSQFDASSLDATMSLDKIEPVYAIGEQNEADDVWLYEVPNHGHKTDPVTDNIFSWVHKEFKTNDIKASKHLLLCKLDDMSNARAIRSVSCHNFVPNRKSDNVKRSLTEQEVNSEPVRNGHVRSISPFHPSIVITNSHENSTVSTMMRSRDTSKEREREPLDYTDLEVMAKMQLENLRQAERQGPLFKRFDRTGTKPPVPPKTTITRNGVKPNNPRVSTMQTNTRTNGHDIPSVPQSKSSVITTRASVLPPNSTNNNRTRPVTARPIQTYRGSQTSYNSTDAKTQLTSASASVLRTVKKVTNGLGSTVPTKELRSTENGLLNDVSNKPSTAPIRSQVGPQRRTVLPHSSTYSAVERIPSSSSSVDIRTHRQTIIPRSSSSTISQGRKSGIPAFGTQQKSATTALARPASSKLNPSSQSWDSKMVTRTARGQQSIGRPQPSIWNEGCY
ncbi:unnamed protein product [Rotaria socialis]|uniref:Uncharacterized protein n=1 Tax=Rotaria socialis TaxID=392032 RepID=A0A820V4K5_9BILA|nr:unnamed protein product [Rotaria socialis]